MKEMKDHPDKKTIEALGGSANLARTLGFQMPNGTIRVNNWKVRGIPYRIRVKRPDLFWPDLSKAQGAEPDAAPPASTPLAGQDDGAVREQKAAGAG